MASHQGLRAFIEDWDGRLQTIIFDLDGTLRHSHPSPTQSFFDFAVRLGVEDSPEKRRQAARWTHYYWAQSEELIQDVQTFVELEDTFWNNYAFRSLLAFDCLPECAHELAPLINQHMKDEYQSEDFVPPDVPETLQTLKAAGFQLGLLSNRDQPCHEHLEQLGLQDYFDLALVAGEVDAWKPDPRIFHHALQRMGCSPEKVVYVGDNYYADVVGARLAGVQPILIDPDEVFPEPGCPVIHTIGELQEFVR